MSIHARSSNSCKTYERLRLQERVASNRRLIAWMDDADAFVARARAYEKRSRSGEQGLSDGEHTSIDAGTIPFYVEAPGAHVSIQGLRLMEERRSIIRWGSICLA